MDQFPAKKLYQLGKIGAIHLNQFEVWGLECLSQKGLDDICHGLEGMNFQETNITKFPILRHLLSGCEILTIVAPNFSKSELMEIRHPELSRDIMFEEIGDQKYLQTTAWNLD